MQRATPREPRSAPDATVLVPAVDVACDPLLVAFAESDFDALPVGLDEDPEEDFELPQLGELDTFDEDADAVRRPAVRPYVDPAVVQEVEEVPRRPFLLTPRARVPLRKPKVEAPVKPTLAKDAPEEVHVFFKRLRALLSTTRRRSWRALIELLVESRVLGTEEGCTCTKPVKDGYGKDILAVWVHANHLLFVVLVGAELTHELRLSLCDGIERYMAQSERDPGTGYPHEYLRPLQDWVMKPVEDVLAKRLYNGSDAPWRVKGRRRVGSKKERLTIESLVLGDC